MNAQLSNNVQTPTSENQIVPNKMDNGIKTKRLRILAHICWQRNDNAAAMMIELEIAEGM